MVEDANKSSGGDLLMWCTKSPNNLCSGGMLASFLIQNAGNELGGVYDALTLGESANGDF
jgi:hypothetical protein